MLGLPFVLLVLLLLLVLSRLFELTESSCGCRGRNSALFQEGSALLPARQRHCLPVSSSSLNLLLPIINLILLRLLIRDIRMLV